MRTRRRRLAAGAGAQGAELLCAERQDLPVIDATAHDVYAGVSKGAYVLEDAANPQVVLIGTGSEVWPALEAAKLLAAEGIARAW
jgi:transketolase